MLASAPTFLRLRAAAVVCAAALGACSKEQKQEAAPPPEVPVADVLQKDTPLDYDLVAQLRGFEDVEIRARVEGYLRSFDYVEGGEVKKGQPLFTIDDLPYRAALAEKEAALARAQSDLAKADLDVRRFTPLAAERAVSQAELDNAVAAERSARAQVAAGQAMITEPGEWVRYSTPGAGGAEYLAVCLPAFSPMLVHRDEE